MANTGALPQNQIDALPLLTPAQAVQASTVIRIGGGLLKSFSGADLGINGIPVTTLVLAGGVTETVLVSNYLDLSFCNRFRIALRRTISDGTAQAALSSNLFSIQMRMGPTDAPAAGYSTGAALNSAFASRAQIGSVGLAFVAIQAGTTQTMQIGWGDSQPQGDGQQAGEAIALGGNCRIIVTWGAGAAPPAVNLFTMWLDAQT